MRNSLNNGPTERGKGRLCIWPALAGLLVVLTWAGLAACSPANAPGDRPRTPDSVGADAEAGVAVASTVDVPATAATAPPSIPATATPTASAPEPITASIPTPTARPTDWEREFRQAGLRKGQWKTDFSRHSVPYSEIFSGGVPRDGIPPIDHPRFTSIADADGWLEDLEPVIVLELNGEARAYPLQIMTFHEIVNDTLGGVPVAVTFCPLCNSAIAFRRELDGVVYDFGVSGNLRNSDLIMWDRQTESWWQQLTGEAIVGKLTGRRLDILPAAMVAWRDFKEAYPEARTLSRDTGHHRDYGRNPYEGYDRVDQPPFLFRGRPDERLLPLERVAALTMGEAALAFPFTLLEAERVIHYPVDGRELVVFFTPGARSALDAHYIADAREVGATGIFARELAGQQLTFQADGNYFLDQETGSRWNILGQGISGPHQGRQLTPLAHANHFWFAWAAFRPDTVVVREAPGGSPADPP